MENMETPEFPSSIFTDLFKDVYEPSEDTFLLMDAIEKDLEEIRHMRPTICLEVGCGSGAVIVSLRKALSSCIFIGTDINPQATIATLRCAETNHCEDSIQVILTDLTSGIQDRLKNSVDILIFNPPYVPTESSEISEKGDVSSAWAGGTSGMQVTNRFIDLLPQLLSSTGKFYLVLIRQNDPVSVCHSLKQKGIQAKICHQRICGSEHLFVISGSQQNK